MRCPYHDVKVTDPDKLAEMTQLLRRLPDARDRRVDPQDIRDVLLPEAMVGMGFAPDPGMDGKALLVQQCEQCHNSRLDPALSRELFLVDQLSTMSRAPRRISRSRGSDCRTPRA